MILLYVCFTDHHPHHYYYRHHDQVQIPILPITSERANITVHLNVMQLFLYVYIQEADV